jgi:hypothetical protein
MSGIKNLDKIFSAKDPSFDKGQNGRLALANQRSSLINKNLKSFSVIFRAEFEWDEVLGMISNVTTKINAERSKTNGPGRIL